MKRTPYNKGVILSYSRYFDTRGPLIFYSKNIFILYVVMTMKKKNLDPSYILYVELPSCWIVVPYVEAGYSTEARKCQII